MGETLFSIVTVTKNNARGLRLTAKSLAIQQDAPAFEWIVIDGASIDATPEVMAEFEAPHIHYISEPDRNLYHAMNKGIERATGRYVWFLNGGDCLADAYVLRDLARELHGAAPPDFVYGDARESGHVKRARDFGDLSQGMITHHQAMLYRRQMIGDLRFNESYKVAADYELTLRFQDKARRIHYMPRILCDFASPGLSHEFAVLARLENYKIREDLLHMPRWKNRIIVKKDQAAFFLKQKCPGFYWRFRASAK